MIYRFVRERAYWVVVAVGLLFLLAGLAIEHYLQVENLLTIIFKVVGISVAAVGLTAPISNYYQFKVLERHMLVVTGAFKAGIERIFVSRRQEEDEFYEVLDQSFRTTRCVTMCGVGFPGFLHHMAMPDNAFRDILENVEISIRVLVIDRTGDPADLRERIESERDTRGHVQVVENTLAIILRVRAQKLGLTPAQLLPNDIGQLNMRVFRYHFHPIAFVVQTDNHVFVEQYHFGKSSTHRHGESIGTRVPVLQFHRDSLTYTVMKNHLDRIMSREEKLSTDITQELLQRV